jgi:hypothetical protein
MKNTFLLLVAGLVLSFSAEAQKKKTKTKTKAKLAVPEVITTSFSSSYATADKNSWSKNYNGYYVANFTNENAQKQKVEYNSKGEVVKSSLTYDVASLPEAITTALQPRYGTATVTEAQRIEMAKMSPYYKVKVKTADNRTKELYISESGIVTE